MPYRVLADMILIVHLGFVLLVVAGGFLVLRWPKLAWVHLPAAFWGVLIEWTGWICPLTPLEQSWRVRGGETGYQGGFVEHYVTAWLYPSGLTRSTQLLLGAVVLVVNAGIYVHLLRRRRRA